jgi:hypothetical protein
MKKLLLFLFLIASLSFCGCNKDETELDMINNQFVIVSKDYNLNTGNLYITYDKNTKVMYYIASAPYKYAISPIYDTDGSIKIYKGDE